MYQYIQLSFLVIHYIASKNLSNSRSWNNWLPNVVIDYIVSKKLRLLFVNWDN